MVHIVGAGCGAAVSSEYPLPEALPAGRVLAGTGKAGILMELTVVGMGPGSLDRMDAAVFIGNSSTKVIGGRMITPRGYKL